MKPDLIGMILGILALTGGVHFLLSNEIYRDLINFSNRAKVKVDDEVLDNAKSVFTFLSTSNGAVMLIFTLLPAYMLFIGIVEGYPLNPGFSFLIAITSLILFLLWSYVFISVQKDIDEIPYKLNKTLWNQQSPLMFKRRKLKFIIWLLYIVFIFNYCWMIWKISGIQNPIKIIDQVELSFLRAAILNFCSWYLTLYWFRPLSCSFKLRLEKEESEMEKQNIYLEGVIHINSDHNVAHIRRKKKKIKK